MWHSDNDDVVCRSNVSMGRKGLEIDLFINRNMYIRLTASLEKTFGTLSLTICSNLEGANGTKSAIPLSAECTRVRT